jgi:hypothetical protein
LLGISTLWGRIGLGSKSILPATGPTLTMVVDKGKRPTTQPHHGMTGFVMCRFDFFHNAIAVGSNGLQ